MPELTMKEEAEDKEDGHERNNMLHDSNDIHIFLNLMLAVSEYTSCF
jgi:hypothetical protein